MTITLILFPNGSRFNSIKGVMKSMLTKPVEFWTIEIGNSLCIKHLAQIQKSYLNTLEHRTKELERLWKDWAKLIHLKESLRIYFKILIKISTQKSLLSKILLIQARLQKISISKKQLAIILMKSLILKLLYKSNSFWEIWLVSKRTSIK